MYRESQPKQLQLAKVLTLRGLRSKEFFSAAVVGLSFAAAHIGYVVGFYVIATHFGAWAPQELNYEESVNTLFPWISCAAIGLLASTNEEFTFRLDAGLFGQYRGMAREGHGAPTAGVSTHLHRPPIGLMTNWPQHLERCFLGGEPRRQTGGPHR